MTLEAISVQEEDFLKRPSQREGLSLLEQLAASSAGSCKNPKSPILFGEDKEANQALVIRVDCKMWNCKVCGSRKAKKWVAKAVNGVNEIGGRWYFGTLTARSNRRSQEASLEDLRKGWFKLRKRIIRKFGAFEYLRVYEQHKDGAFHMHLIMNAPIPTKFIEEKDGKKAHWYCKYLKNEALACGMGFMADYQPLQSAAGAAYYVAKYLTKSIGAAGESWPKSVHRIRTSNKWPVLPDLTEETDIAWDYVQSSSHLWWLSYLAADRGRKLYNQYGMVSTPAQLVEWFKDHKEGFYEQRAIENERGGYDHAGIKLGSRQAKSRDGKPKGENSGKFEKQGT